MLFAIEEEIMSDVYCYLLGAGASCYSLPVSANLPDKVEKFIPPKKGKSHILRMIREMLDFKSDSKGTNISEAVNYFSKTIKKRSIAFVISDFLDDHFQDSLKLAKRRHDLIGIRIEDGREGMLPDIGWVNFIDPETEEKRWINTSRKKVRKDYAKRFIEKRTQLTHFFNKAGIDNCIIETGKDYIKPLLMLFKNR